MELRWVAVEAEDKVTGERSRSTLEVRVPADAEEWRAQAMTLGARDYPEARMRRASGDAVLLEDARHEVTVWPLRLTGPASAAGPPGQAVLFAG